MSRAWNRALCNDGKSPKDIWESGADQTWCLARFCFCILSLCLHNLTGNCYQEAEMQANSLMSVPSATSDFSVGCLPCLFLVRDTLEAWRCQSGKDRFILCNHPQRSGGVHNTKGTLQEEQPLLVVPPAGSEVLLCFRMFAEDLHQNTKIILVPDSVMLTASEH